MEVWWVGRHYLDNFSGTKREIYDKKILVGKNWHFFGMKMGSFSIVRRLPILLLLNLRIRMNLIKRSHKRFKQRMSI